MKTVLKAIVYGMAELATAGRGVARVVGGERIRFPARWCRYYPADYEPATFAFLRDHCGPGSTALDIGAHLGLFSVTMARLVGPAGRVFSFEPTTLTRQILERTVRLNGCEGVVEVRHEAVALTSGTAVFHDTGETGSNANSLIPTKRSQAGMAVPTVSVDDFLSERDLQANCLKIDVEGAELDLLRGAERTFATSRPPTYLAVHPAAVNESGGSLKEIWRLVSRYRMRVTRAGETVTEAAFCQSVDLFDVALIPT